jgi:hypothetical protein
LSASTSGASTSSPERRAREHEPADDAERGGDHEGNQRFVDRDRHVVDERAVLDQVPELLRDQHRRADPERVHQPDRHDQLPDSDDGEDHGDARQDHPAAVELSLAGRGEAGIERRRLRFGHGHGQ